MQACLEEEKKEKEKYERPQIEKIDEMMFSFAAIKALPTKIACRQCSSCHSCR